MDAHRAVVVSNDSDLARAVHIVRKEIGKAVFVFHPISAHPSFQLKQAATRFREVTVAYLSASQLPPTITDARGTFNKPPMW